MDLITMGLMGASALTKASGERKEAASDRRKLEYESDVAGINAQAATKHAEFEMQGWEQAADQAANINALRTEFASQGLDRDASVAQYLAQYQTDFAINAVDSQAYLSEKTLGAQYLGNKRELDQYAAMVGIKAGQARGRARASLAARGIEMDSGSTQEIVDSIELSKNMDYAALQNKSLEIAQHFYAQSASGELQKTARIGQAKMDLLKYKTSQSHELQAKKQQMAFDRDLDNFLSRQQIKADALSRAWGYQAQATDNRVKQRNVRSSAKSIKPNTDFLSSLIGSAGGMYGAFKTGA